MTSRNKLLEKNVALYKCHKTQYLKNTARMEKQTFTLKFITIKSIKNKSNPSKCTCLLCYAHVFGLIGNFNVTLYFA